LDEKVAALRTQGALAGLAVLVVGLIVAVLFSRSITVPLQELVAATNRIAGGDLAHRITVQGGDEIAALASAFNTMTGQLQHTLEGLEQRTRDLALSAEISRRLSSILDQKQLITEVVEQLQSGFHYYHVHIYLYDERREYLVMAGGTGEAARAMLARGHRLEEGRGLVGRAAGTNSPVLVPDVSKDPGWLPNPLLPDTKSEMAVPITVGTRILGVLDVQHNIVNGLKQDDVQLIQLVSNQIAIALQNTLSFQQAEQQAQRETIINTVTEKIQRATTVESVLQIATRELGQALRAQRASANVSLAQLRNNYEKTNGH
jgi:nitrate/nitrite-specific signal transduction histidine kinase